MTTAAKFYRRQKKACQRTQRGQSIIEFAFFMPLYLGLIYYLMQICMAINGGHVLQQYTRARLFEMLNNHPEYPALRWTLPSTGGGRQGGWQRFWIGMDKEKWGGADDAAQRDDGQTPTATIVKVGSRSIAGDDDSNNFPPTKRQNLRLRIISFICMPPKLLAPNPSDPSGPQFLTEKIGDDVRNWYTTGFGTHVSFCWD